MNGPARVLPRTITELGYRAGPDAAVEVMGEPYTLRA